MGKKTKSSSQTTAAPLTAEQKELLQLEIEKAGFQLESIGEQSEFQSFLFNQFFGGEFEDQSGDPNISKTIQDTQFQQAMDALGISSDALFRESELAAGGAKIDPETAAFIDQIFEGQFESGASAIDRQVTDALQLVREELAPSRGLRGSDTPITDRGFRIAGEGQRSKGELLSTLSANAAASKLNFPLQQGQLTSARNQFLTNFGSASAGFANDLQQQAFLNRLNLINTTGGLGLGLATGIASNPGGTAVGLQQGGTTSSTVNAPLNFGSLLSGGGALLTGIDDVFCWVAREVYGVDNPKWLLFRGWMLTEAPKWLLRLYMRFGERISQIIRPMNRVKSILRYFMDNAIDG